ncbi:MAG: hypothetical protein ACREI1_02315 [Nitrospiraceae bacterium]
MSLRPSYLGKVEELKRNLRVLVVSASAGNIHHVRDRDHSLSQHAAQDGGWCEQGRGSRR